MSQHYWFPAKRYGWGWGAPTAWQGWAVLALYFALFAAGAIAFALTTSLAAFIAWAVALNLALVAICWWKGEPPRWRWGGE